MLSPISPVSNKMIPHLASFEWLYVACTLATLSGCIFAKSVLPFHPGGTMENARIAYSLTSGVAFAVCVGCTLKAALTQSAQKAKLATRLAVHSGVVAVAMFCCSLDIVYILVGTNGHHVNLVAQMVWFLTSASMASLFHRLAYYVIGMSEAGDETSGPLLISVTAFCRETLTVLARLSPHNEVANLRVLSSLAICFISLSVWLKWKVMAPYFTRTTVASPRGAMIMTLIAIFIAMAAADLCFLAYAANKITGLTSEVVLCICISGRILLLYVRCTMAMLYNDEKAAAEAQLAQQKLLLQQKHDEERKQLYRLIFHELRVPLNSIILGLQLCKATPLIATVDEPKGTIAPPSCHRLEADTVEMMHSSASSMLSILSDLLDIAKIEARAFVLRVSPFSVRALLSTAANNVKPLAINRNVQVNVFVDASVPPCVVGDAPRLSQILANFLSNALKFCPADGMGRVTLTATQVCAPQLAPDMVMIELACADNGPGVTPTEVDKLFQSFSQLDNAQMVPMRGSGLGLAICAQIARLHGGQIGCTAGSGKGCKFHVTIPFKLGRAEDLPDFVNRLSPEEIPTAPTFVSPHSSADSPDPSLSGKKSVESFILAAPPDDAKVTVEPPFRALVVDDDGTNRTLLARLLRKYLPKGTVIDTAADGKLGFEAATATTYDLICLDGHMPVMNGLESVSAMRANGVQSLVIGCTANTLQEDQDRFVAAGADAVCVKPVDINQLLRLVRERGLIE